MERVVLVSGPFPRSVYCFLLFYPIFAFRHEFLLGKFEYSTLGCNLEICRTTASKHSRFCGTGGHEVLLGPDGVTKSNHFPFWQAERRLHVSVGFERLVTS